MVRLETAAVRRQAATLTSDPPVSDSIAQLVHPADQVWRARHEVSADIERRLESSPYRYFNDLRTTKNDLVLSLKVIKSEIQELGAEARVLRDNMRGVSYASSVLDVFLAHCSVLPQEPQAAAQLKTAVSDLQCELSRLYVPHREDYSAIATELGGKIQRFSQLADGFFVYEARKYAIVSYAQETQADAPLSIKFSVLDSMLGHPQAYIFDIDDCLIASEHAHRDCWGAAIKAWAYKQGFTQRDPEGVAKLIRTVRYCLAKDATAELLQLLSDICDRRGFVFDVPTGKTPLTALEDAIIPYRTAVLLDMAERRRIQCMPGALEILKHALFSDKLLAACTNSPRDVAIPLLSKVISLAVPNVDFNDFFEKHCCVFGDTTRVRKPFPLMWLAAANALGVRPPNAVIFDNSLNNCIGASDLSPYQHHKDMLAYGSDLLRPNENFAGVVGLTNGSALLEPWRAWARSAERRPVKVVLRGFDHISGG